MAVANASPAPLNLPQPPQAWNTGWQQRYTQALVQASVNWLQKGNDILLDANTTFTLTSPDGTTQVTIVANDDGTIGPVPAPAPALTGTNNTWTGTNTFTNTVTLPNGSITASEVASGVAVANLGFTPVTQGGGLDQGTNTIHIGWDTGGVALRCTVDTTSQGWLYTSKNNLATTAQILSNTNAGTDALISNQGGWAAVVPTTITAGTSVACDMSTGIHFVQNVTGAPTISFSNMKNGQSGTVSLINTTGTNFTLAAGTNAAFSGTANYSVNTGAWSVFAYLYIANIAAVIVTRMF